jgi:hypothetical protein
MIDYELLFSIFITAVAVIREAQRRQMDAQLNAVVKASGDELAYIYDRAMNGELCTQATAAGIATKTGNVWTLLASLSKTAADILDQKTALATTLRPPVPVMPPVSTLVQPNQAV